MTAEIAILNSNAVAMAADSAVTIGREAGKVYTSADKLFQMSNNAPVGIMFYGKAVLLGVPWETVVKCYRSELGNKTFPRLEDYLKDFTRFVKRSRQMFPRKHQRDHVRSIILSFFHFIRERFKEITTHEYDQHRKMTEIEVKRLFADLVQEELQKTINQYAQTNDYILFDTDSKSFGGTGKTFDWNLLNDIEIPLPYFLSGGISEENIENISILKQKPFALDINSRFETEPGVKNISRIKIFKEKLI